MQNKKIMKQYYIFFIIMSLLLFVDLNVSFVFAQNELTDEEKQKLEEKQEEYEEKKEKYEEKVEEAQQKKSQLQGELGVVQKNLGATQRTIDVVIAEIEEKEQDIDRHNAQIETLDKQIILYKKALSDTVLRAYFASSNKSLISIIENDSSQRFLNKTDTLDDVREEVIKVTEQIETNKQIQEQKKKELKALKEEKEQLLEEHKSAESQLLAQSSAVQTEIAQVNVSIAELNAKLSAVESKLSALLGDDFDTDDIVEAAKFASSKTGVRKSFILGMLVVETDLGRFTGGCTYKKSKMGDANEKIFKRICEDLDYDYKKVKVSCPLSYGIGGAMGVAQFMPTTWVGYESKIESYTGHSPADPWSLTDGVMAMAIKLANDGASSKKGEFDAARRYYCGSNIDRSVCKNYANKVIYWAENYKDRL